VELWNAATRELIGTLNDDAGTVNAIVFSPDGKLLAIGSDNAVSLWDIATRERVETLAVGHELVDVKFRPDGKILAALCVSSVCRWDVSDLVVT
jgi:WD40 repeat protein